MMKQAVFLGLLVCPAFAAIGDDSTHKFSHPQQVYRTEVETAPIENGGIHSQSALELTQLIVGVSQAPEAIEVTDGIYTIVGISAANMTVIEGDQGIIVYDTGDDLKEAGELMELVRTVTDKPVVALIYSHAHYVWGAQAIVDQATDGNIPVIGNERLNSNILESGGLGSAIPELAPSLLARTLQQSVNCFLKKARMGVHRHHSLIIQRASCPSILPLQMARP